MLLPVQLVMISLELFFVPEREVGTSSYGNTG